MKETDLSHGTDAELRERYVSGVRTEVAIARLRSDVAAAHTELVSAGAINPAGGAVSARVPGADLFVISPASVPLRDVAPENLVLCDLDGSVVAGTPGSKGMPSPQHRAHADAYASARQIGGIVSTAAAHISAWSAISEPIPCALVAVAEHFGGAIPVGPEAGHDADTGRALAGVLAGRGSGAVLLPHRGAIVAGTDVDDAVRVASLLEIIARTMHLARALGALRALPADVIGRSADGRPAPHSQTRESTTEHNSMTMTSQSR